MLSEGDRRAAAAVLAAAERNVRPVAPVTETYPGLGVTDAYAIQQINVGARVADGVVVKGHKIGLTSGAIQRQLGVIEPDYGHLLSDMFVADGSAAEIAALCQPQVEPEVAFVLSRPLGGGAVTAEDVVAATAYVLPALEIIDSRIERWRISLADTVADNASSARVVLGGTRSPADALPLGQLAAVLHKNGEVAEKGLSGDVLGNPAVAVAWLANKLAVFGIGLAAGHVVLSGSCTRAVAAAPGDEFRADLDGLGSVSVSFR